MTGLSNLNPTSHNFISIHKLGVSLPLASSKVCLCILFDDFYVKFISSPWRILEPQIPATDSGDSPDDCCRNSTLMHGCVFLLSLFIFSLQQKVNQFTKCESDRIRVLLWLAPARPSPWITFRDWPCTLTPDWIWPASHPTQRIQSADQLHTAHLTHRIKGWALLPSIINSSVLRVALPSDSSALAK